MNTFKRIVKGSVAWFVLILVTPLLMSMSILRFVIMWAREEWELVSELWEKTAGHRNGTDPLW